MTGPRERLEVAIVGAGLSGLTCARGLAARGHRVRVFDKGRRVGGRMSIRREGALRFDHGAQYFTVRAPEFERQVEAWIEQGTVARWHGDIAVIEGGAIRSSPRRTERFVGVPGMDALCASLAEEIEVHVETRVEALERSGDRWRLHSADGTDLGHHQAVVVSAPAPQTADLLAGVAPALAALAARAEIAPCWAVMAAFDRPLDLGFDGAFVNGSPLSWIARNASKPGRPEGETWVLHGSPEWSLANLALEPSAVAGRLVDALRRATGGADLEPTHLDAHRWSFALPTQPLPEACLFDARARLAACGDWCGGPRVEGAYLSGRAAAARLV